MNDSTLTQLKIMVERAVRPVRTSLSRKRKMREELLAHVASVFEEERVRLGDDCNALARTGQRFGNAAELTIQLQASVPWNDKAAWYWENLFKKPGTSPFYRASRLALITATFGTVAVGLGMLFGEQQPLFVFSFLFIIVMVLSVSWFLFLPLINWLQHRLFTTPGSSWKKVAQVVLVSGAFLLPVWSIGLLISTAFNLGPSVVDSLPMLGLAGVLTPLAFIFLTRVAHDESRQYQEWAKLPIEKGGWPVIE